MGHYNKPEQFKKTHTFCRRFIWQTAFGTIKQSIKNTREKKERVNSTYRSRWHIVSKRYIYQKIKIGASAVQIYTGFVYHGPRHIKKMEIELKKLLLQDGYSSIDHAVGALIR